MVHKTFYHFYKLTFEFDQGEHHQSPRPHLISKYNNDGYKLQNFLKRNADKVDLELLPCTSKDFTRYFSSIS